MDERLDPLLRRLYARSPKEVGTRGLALSPGVPVLDTGAPLAPVQLKIRRREFEFFASVREVGHRFAGRLVIVSWRPHDLRLAAYYGILPRGGQAISTWWNCENP